MRESPVEVAVGAAVLAVAVGFLVLAGRSTGFMATDGDMVLHASFRSVEGVAPGSEVRLAGVRLGSVTGVVMNPETYRAETAMTVTSAVPIPDDSTAVIASEGLLGGSYVEIVPGGSMTYLADGAEIIDTQGAISLLNLLVQAVGSAVDSE